MTVFSFQATRLGSRGGKHFKLNIATPTHTSIFTKFHKKRFFIQPHHQKKSRVNDSKYKKMIGKQPHPYMAYPREFGIKVNS